MTSSTSSTITHMNLDADTQQNILQLRGVWEFQNVAQFFHTFYAAFGLETFDTDEFERNLASSGSAQLTDLLARMLRILTSNKKIGANDLEQKLRQQYQVHAPEKKLLGGDQSPRSFESLSSKEKILVFHDLCHWQLRSADKFRSHLSSQDNPADWRVSPVGYDAKGNTYWLFDDNRLCKEQHIAPPPQPKKSKAKGKARKGSRRNGVEDTNEDNPNITINNSDTMIWETLCITIEDWENFPQRFAKSRNAAEKEFYALLTEDIAPKVLEDLRTKEKERKKVEAVANRKRSQRIIEKEIAKKETERLVKVEEESNPMLQKGNKHSISIRSNGARLTRQSHKRSHTEIEDEVDREQRYKVQRAARESRMLRRNGGDGSQEPSENGNILDEIEDDVQIQMQDRTQQENQNQNRMPIEQQQYPLKTEAQSPVQETDNDLENNVTSVSNGAQSNIPTDTPPINSLITVLFNATSNHQPADSHAHTTTSQATTSYTTTSHATTSHATTSHATTSRTIVNRSNANHSNANRVNANRVNANRVNANRVNANRVNANRINANHQANGQSDNQQEEDEQSEQMDDWYFECNCGLTGINIDDNRRMIACDRCAVWQHLDCLIAVDERYREINDYENVNYICRRCSLFVNP